MPGHRLAGAIQFAVVHPELNQDVLLLSLAASLGALGWRPYRRKARLGLPARALTIGRVARRRKRHSAALTGLRAHLRATNYLLHHQDVWCAHVLDHHDDSPVSIASALVDPVLEPPVARPVAGQRPCVWRAVRQRYGGREGAARKEQAREHIPDARASSMGTVRSGLGDTDALNVKPPKPALPVPSAVLSLEAGVGKSG